VPWGWLTPWFDNEERAQIDATNLVEAWAEALHGAAFAAGNAPSNRVGLLAKEVAFRWKPGTDCGGETEKGEKRTLHDVDDKDQSFPY